MKRYEVLDHVSDAYIEAYGSSLEEAFENAALGLFDVMVDISRVKRVFKDQFTVEAEDEESLLHDWLSTLHLKFEMEGKAYGSFKVHRIKKVSGVCRLTAKAYGEVFDPDRHAPKTEVKAVTRHRMGVTKSGGRWVVRFLLDL
ncbi:MAG: archease [Candidatus Bathyarchaeia archaeon]